jgi:hypothetical protein
MIPHHKSIVTGGGTPSDGELRIWQDLTPEDKGHLLYRDKRAGSIYALDISPTGTYLASGSKIGLVRVWSFLDHDLPEKAPFHFEIYHQIGPVTALAFLTDDLLLSGGFNGKIRIISISDKKCLYELEAHSGPICSLVSLGSRGAASLGTDGKVKIWDMETRSCIFQRDGFAFPKNSLSLFPALAFSSEPGYLFSPSAEGKLHLFDLRNECAHDSLEVHEGAFYGMAACGKLLVTGGVADKTLNLWDVNQRKLLYKIDSGSSFLRLKFLGETEVVAVCFDSKESHSLRRYSLPDLKQSAIMVDLDLRSLATVPASTIEHKTKAEYVRWRNGLINQARSMLTDPEGMEPLLEQLRENGLREDAILLQAESARERDKPLHELILLLDLTEAVEVSQDNVPNLKRLAFLLEHLNEPRLAILNYEKVRSFVDVEQDILRLSNHPLLSLVPENTIRSDISSLESAIQEMNKDAFLNRPFKWRLLLSDGPATMFKVLRLQDLHDWENQIRTYAHSGDRTVELAKETVTMFDGKNCRTMNWLRISAIEGLEFPSPYVDFAIEIDKEKRLAQCYGVFNPNKQTASTEDLVDHNGTLALAYHSIFNQRNVRTWLNTLGEKIQQCDFAANAYR